MDLLISLSTLKSFQLSNSCSLRTYHRLRPNNALPFSVEFGRSAPCLTQLLVPGPFSCPPPSPRPRITPACSPCPPRVPTAAHRGDRQPPARATSAPRAAVPVDGGGAGQAPWRCHGHLQPLLPCLCTAAPQPPRFSPKMSRCCQQMPCRYLCIDAFPPLPHLSSH